MTGMKPGERATIVRYAMGHTGLRGKALAIHAAQAGRGPVARGMDARMDAPHMAFMDAAARLPATHGAGPERSALIAAAPIPMATARVQRAKDWPKALHSACDAMEEASDDMLNAATADEVGAATADYQEKRAAYGREALALDRLRRPSAYRDTEEDARP